MYSPTDAERLWLQRLPTATWALSCGVIGAAALFCGLMVVHHNPEQPHFATPGVGILIRFWFTLFLMAVMAGLNTFLVIKLYKWIFHH